MLVVIALVSASGCSRKSGDIAAPQRVDEATGATTTSLPFTEAATTTIAATSTTATTAASTTAASTTAPPTTAARATSTTRTTNPASTTTRPGAQTTLRAPTNISLEVAQSNLPCPSFQLAFAAVWSIGTATPGTGRLAFNGEAPRPVADTGREERCVSPGTHTYSYSATGPGGPATRVATFSWH
jgi:hypothetical protein